MQQTDTSLIPGHNRQLVEQLYQYFADSQFDQLPEVLHNDIEWTQMGGFPNGGRHKGISAVIKNVFGAFKQDWIGWMAVATEMIEATNAVFVIGYYSGTHASTGKSFTADFIHHYQVKDGKISHFKQYTDTAQIWKATTR
ncbi:MAG TPA: nuclear transport factor 2 family protein [Flavisolibacter sp.]|nr:nuclear transport factor 2 family protein [Flavisolibacter sp.]